VSLELVDDAPRPVVNGEVNPTGEIRSTSVTIGPITDSKTYADSEDGYGSGTITTDGCWLPKIPAADMLIDYLIGKTRQRRVIRS
jgi:hypothetical protein